MKLPLYVIRRTEAAGGGYWNGAGWCREATEAYSEDERFWAIGSAWERDQNIEVIQLETSDAEPESEAEDPEVPPIITREYRDALAFADANPPTEVSFEGKVGWTAEDRSGLQSLKVEWNDQCKSGSIPCGSRIRVTVLKEKAD